MKPESVDFAIAMAPKLRRAGVTRFRCGELEFDIGPEVDEPPPATPAEQRDSVPFMNQRHAIDDGAAFGGPPGSPPPSYRRKPKDE
jgi:hypothetical protein